MTLYAGGASAEVTVAGRAIDLVRQGKLVYSATAQRRTDPRLEAGDVVRLAGPDDAGQVVAGQINPSDPRSAATHGGRG
jgi:hypothetical protein